MCGQGERGHQLFSHDAGEVLGGAEVESEAPSGALPLTAAAVVDLATVFGQSEHTTTMHCSAQ